MPDEIRRSRLPDSAFIEELDQFWRQISEPTQYLFADRAINLVAGRNRKLVRAFNDTPMFWNTVAGALQYASIVSLGRVFDPTGACTVHRIYRLAEQNRHLFSRKALAQRKLRMSENAPEWVDSFVASAHVPTTADFRRLRAHINKHAD